MPINEVKPSQRQSTPPPAAKPPAAPAQEEEETEQSGELFSDILGYGMVAVMTLIVIGVVIWFGS